LGDKDIGDVHDGLCVLDELHTLVEISQLQQECGVSKRSLATCKELARPSRDSIPSRRMRFW
jgi:hypothetical protein